MLQIDCPNCGPRAQVEFAYERTFDSIVHIAVSPAEAMATLYRRANPRGWSDELWHHRFGCRRWLVVRCNTATHEIASVAEVAP